LQDFNAGMEGHMEDPERFRSCLLPCNSVINMLVEKVPEFMLSSGDDGGLNVPRVIINQLKWLDRVLDSKELATKLMELVSVAPVEVQRDVITSLPEILDDSQHNDVARELKALLLEKTQLTVAILDTLSSLNLSSALLAEVRGVVTATLTAVQLDDLPVVVKFILHSVSASDAYEVSDLRLKLELDQWAVSPVLKASQKRLKGRTPAPTVKRRCVRSLKHPAEVYLTQFLPTLPSVLQVIDVLLLLILHATNANHSRRGAERLLRLKARAGLITEELLQRTFKGYVMRGFFPSIRALAQSLLRSPDTAVVPFGGHMYRLSFITFDSYCQQEVVGSLVAHVCSGVGGEVDVALELLCGLGAEHPSEMVLYAVFVKGILDYMDHLTPRQIRRLFQVLSRLAFGAPSLGCSIQDDMHIVIRKQLSSTVPKYKRIGIMGAVMVVGSMGASRPQAEGSQSAALPQETYRQVTALLELVTACSVGCPEAAALCYDELANLVLSNILDPTVQEWIGKSVLEDFQDDFVVDLGPQITGSLPLPACVLFNLDEEESEGGIAVNLLPLLAREVQHRAEPWSSKTPKRQVSAVCLSPFFRLLRVCEERQHQGDLEEIDALLGCPLILTDLAVVDKLETLTKAERELMCSLLFTAINWFREVVNGFCRLRETEMKMKVMNRLQNITALQTMLETTLAVSPGYIPPLANFDGDASEAASAEKAEKGKKEEKAEKGKKGEKEGRPSVSLGGYRPFFRELDMEVLSVLQCGLLPRKAPDTELNTKEREEVLLGPAELLFLLEDLQAKLEFSLTAAPAKRVPFAKKSVGFSHLHQRSSKEVASYCIQLLPSLCSHLEGCHNHFQTVLSENGGVVDGPATDPLEHQLLSSAYQLLLQVLNTTFSWSGFSQPGHRSLLKSALALLASRLKEGAPDLTLEQLVRIYLEHVDDVLTAVEEIAGEGVAELVNAAKDASSETWPTLTSGPQETLTSDVFLQFGRLFLDAFLRLGMPLLDHSFKKHKEDVQSLLKTFQLSTRQLHHMCGHSKIRQDTSLTNHVPALKKSLEVFIYRVKAMLTLNNCQEAFWTGNLKNRDLKVNISASIALEEQDEEQAEEEVLPMFESLSSRV
uniref:FA complementation group D2 n=1 Tax=Gadus morhua TaxID=8049 RepID=A0A8C5AFA7_GADMO